ncbi:MAG: hypothetical protein C0614_10010 [Desulfuromonas sp.]|nr:MAG: hypothetical protein C0614_10010 [Desulfuromonas sp.]
MFVWDKSIQRIETDVTNVVQLFRSMRDVQMALPGLPVQESCAYLCQYRVGSEIATVAAFHMQKSQQLAFYVSQPSRVAENRADEMFDSGLGFVESMGFLLCDMDLGLHDEQDRSMLWESLPIFLGEGVGQQTATSSPQPAPVKKAVEPAKPTPPPAAKPQPSQPPPAATAVVQATPVTEKTVPVEPPHSPAAVQESGPEVDDSVDDLLAAVEALRAKRPGMQTRRRSIKPAEIQKRRIELRQNLGRILVSL